MLLHYQAVCEYPLCSIVHLSTEEWLNCYLSTYLAIVLSIQLLNLDVKLHIKVFLWCASQEHLISKTFSDYGPSFCACHFK